MWKPVFIIPLLYLLSFVGVSSLGQEGNLYGSESPSLGGPPREILNLTVQMVFDPAERNMGEWFSQIVLGGVAAYDVDDDGTIEILLNFRKTEDRIVCISGVDMSVEWIFPPPWIRTSLWEIPCVILQSGTWIEMNWSRSSSPPEAAASTVSTGRAA